VATRSIGERRWGLALLLSVSTTACSEPTPPPPELRRLPGEPELRCAADLDSTVARVEGSNDDVANPWISVAIESTGRVEVRRLFGGSDPHMVATEVCLTAAATEALLLGAVARASAPRAPSPTASRWEREDAVCTTRIRRADQTVARADPDGPCVGSEWWSEVLLAADTAETASDGPCSMSPCRVALDRWTHFYGGHHGGDAEPRFELWQNGRYACGGRAAGRLSTDSAAALLRWLVADIDLTELRASPDTSNLAPAAEVPRVEAWGTAGSGWLDRRAAEAVEARYGQVDAQLCGT